MHIPNHVRPKAAQNLFYRILSPNHGLQDIHQILSALLPTNVKTFLKFLTSYSSSTQPTTSQPEQAFVLADTAALWAIVLSEVIENAQLLELERKVELFHLHALLEVYLTDRKPCPQQQDVCRSIKTTA